MRDQIENLVSILEPHRIRIERATVELLSQLRDSGISVRGDEVRLADLDDMIRMAKSLAEKGAVFMGDAAGWPPAAVLVDLKARGKFDPMFVEVLWRDPRNVQRIVHPFGRSNR